MRRQRHSGADVFAHDHVVVAVPGLTHRVFDAQVGRDPAHDHGGDAQAAQMEVELGAEEGAAPLLHQDVVRGLGAQLVDEFGARRPGDQRALLLGRHGLACNDQLGQLVDDVEVIGAPDHGDEEHGRTGGSRHVHEPGHTRHDALLLNLAEDRTVERPLVVADDVVLKVDEDQRGPGRHQCGIQAGVGTGGVGSHAKVLVCRG